MSKFGLDDLQEQSLIRGDPWKNRIQLGIVTVLGILVLGTLLLIHRSYPETLCL
jgi:hypothetical protein